MIMVQALLMAGVRAADLKVHPLDERSVYTIHLNRDEPTTCVFPAPIKAIVGANVSQKADDQPGILLAHEAGAEYFSLRLLKEDAKGALNVILRGKVYALVFIPGQEADRAVVFLDQKPEETAGPAAKEELFRGLVQKARELEREDSAEGRVASVTRSRPGNATAYRNFTATIESVVRFEAEDALVFRVRLENTQATAVPYDRDNLAIQLDREFFPAAYAEASGAIPGGGSGIVHLVIAGAPGGGRANLSVRGKYRVTVPHS